MLMKPPAIPAAVPLSVPLTKYVLLPIRLLPPEPPSTAPLKLPPARINPSLPDPPVRFATPLKLVAPSTVPLSPPVTLNVEPVFVPVNVVPAPLPT